MYECLLITGFLTIYSRFFFACFAEDERSGPERRRDDAGEDAAPGQSSGSSGSDGDSSEEDSDDGVMHRIKSSVAHIRVSAVV